MEIDEFQERARALVLVLTNAKIEAGRLGLWKTMHSIEEPVTTVGYEIAEVLEGKHPTKPTKPGFWGTPVPLQKR